MTKHYFHSITKINSLIDLHVTLFIDIKEKVNHKGRTIHFPYD